MAESKSFIEKTLRSWIEGKDPVQARIAVYEKIRDIPYAVLPELNDSRNYGNILKTGRGSCTPKHFLLAEMFQRLGYLVLFVVYPFRWNEPGGIMDYLPVKTKGMADAQPLSYHLACKVEIENRFVLVDATLDPSLSKLEILPVNLNWDGFSDTLLPVIPAGEEMIFHPSEANSMRPRDDEPSRAFYTELNLRLEEIRRQS